MISKAFFVNQFYSISILMIFGIVGGLWFPQTASGQDSESLQLEWSKEAGIHPEAIYLRITCSDPSAKIHFTTDGNKPNSKSPVVKRGISVKRTSLIKARAIKGDQKSEVETRTFFIGEQSTFPLISLGVKPNKLFDEEDGLFRMGPKADSLFPFSGANFWSREEIKMHLEYFTPEGEQVVSQKGGMRMFGGMSRLFAQKSLALVARGDYGPKRIEYQVFQGKDIEKFKYIALRNSGSDWSKTHLRDAYFTDLVKHLDFETQAYQPTHTFINGKYWGIYNAREKINRFFLSSNCGYHKDSLEIIEHRNNVRRGNGKHYRQMIRFIEKHDLDIPANYDIVKSMMEIQSFMDLQIVQIFLDNRDAGGNIKYWRPNRPGGRWRWVLYDTDFGMGLHDDKAYRNNSLAFHTRPDGPNWPNPPWSTFLLRNLLTSPEFEAEFVRRFCDHLNTVFQSDHMTQKLDDIIAVYEPEIDRHIRRWKLSNSLREQHLKRMYTFIEKRPAYVRRFLKDRFDLAEEVTLYVQQNQGGQLLLNGHLELAASSYRGRYFGNMTIQLEAQPYFGHQFDYWLLPDGTRKQAAQIEIAFNDQDQRVEAVFKSSRHPLEGQIVINEIACNNPPAGDWLELYNQSKTSVNLDGWYIRDLQQSWQLPAFELAADAHVVLCRDSAAFREVFGPSIPILGNLPFGLSRSKERLELYTSYRAPIDSLDYQFTAPDSNFVYLLDAPQLNNAQPDNWQLFPGTGSPGQHNPPYIQQQEAQRTKVFYAGIGGAACMLLLILGVFTVRKRPVE